MSVYNVTVDDSSPMISYSEGWIDSNPSDIQLSSYSENTFHATRSPSASASVSFFGNAVYIFGAMRKGYGPFTVSLDGQDTSGNSAASDGEVFQRLLFARAGMSDEEHTLVLTNNGTGTSVDIDFVVFTTGNPNSTTQPVNSTLDDTAPQIKYTPGVSAWDTTSSLRSSYHNDSLHESQVGGAQVVVPFTGDAVFVYGSTSQSHGTFSVRIDGRDNVQLNGSAPTFRAQTLLYWAGGLGSGQHQLEVTNTQDLLFLDFDFLVATSWNSSVSSPTSIHHPKSKTPIIAGVISGTCVVVAWIVALFFLLRRRRKRHRETLSADRAEANPEPFILPPDPAVVDGSHRPGEYAFGNQRFGKAPIPAPIPRPQAKTASSTSYPPAPTSSPQTHSHTRSQDTGTYASDAPTSVSSPVPVPPRLPGPSVAMAVQLLRETSSSQDVTSTGDPANASDAQTGISIEELSASRMTVPNRPQDWGPIIPLSNDEHQEGLPPDYQQATQPMPRASAVHHTAERPDV